MADDGEKQKKEEGEEEVEGRFSLNGRELRRAPAEYTGSSAELGGQVCGSLEEEGGGQKKEDDEGDQGAPASGKECTSTATSLRRDTFPQPGLSHTREQAENGDREGEQVNQQEEQDTLERPPSDTPQLPPQSQLQLQHDAPTSPDTSFPGRLPGDLAGDRSNPPPPTPLSPVSSTSSSTFLRSTPNQKQGEQEQQSRKFPQTHHQPCSHPGEPDQRVPSFIPTRFSSSSSGTMMGEGGAPCVTTQNGVASSPSGE